ncbi:hypothetical protein Neosp_005567 [[Neocosmospora] mangrovei]
MGAFGVRPGESSLVTSSAVVTNASSPPSAPSVPAVPPTVPSSAPAPSPSPLVTGLGLREQPGPESEPEPYISTHQTEPWEHHHIMSKATHARANVLRESGCRAFSSFIITALQSGDHSSGSLEQRCSGKSSFQMLHYPILTPARTF